jgi:Immunity protein 72/Immunity protein 71
MNTSVMSQEERRKVFWLIKKYSSYTAWRALAEAYYAFAAAWMVAMRTASDADIDEFNQGATRDILDGRIGFEKGLLRLRAGDRSVWRLGAAGYGGWGELQKASYQLNFIRKIMDPMEYVFDWMKNKDQVVAANDALQSMRFCQESIMEPSEGNPAPMAPWNALATVHPVYGLPMNDPKHLNFPALLPETPSPSGIVVDTGTEVLIDGIYEPEWGDIEALASSGLLGKIKLALVGKPSLTESPTEVVSARREHIGCLNYLLANTAAPPYQDREQDQPMPVTWRLIWKDERYLDGVIPAEESEYLAPVAEPTVATAQLRCEAGQPCPREGFWFTPARLSSRRHFKSAEPMPDVGGSYGATIWQWDEAQ